MFIFVVAHTRKAMTVQPLILKIALYSCFELMIISYHQNQQVTKPIYLVTLLDLHYIYVFAYMCIVVSTLAIPRAKRPINSQLRITVEFFLQHCFCSSLIMSCHVHNTTLLFKRSRISVPWVSSHILHYVCTYMELLLMRLGRLTAVDMIDAHRNNY